MSRSVGPMALTALPSIETVPAEIDSSPAIMRSSVDLPHPDGPTNTQSWRSGTAMLTPFTASTPPGRSLRTSFRSTVAIGSMLSLFCFDQALTEPLLHQHLYQ